MLDPSYNIYMDVQQDINLSTMEAFNEIGVSFALPSRTVYAASIPGDEASVGHSKEWL